MRRIQPDRAALEIAWSKKTSRPLTLEQMLADTNQRRIIENEARAHMRRRIRFDIRKIQSGDRDD
jgi:hypothetical protein